MAAAPSPPATLLSSAAAPPAASTVSAASISLPLATATSVCPTSSSTTSAAASSTILPVATLTIATLTIAATILLPSLLLLPLRPRARRHRASATTVQAAWRGHATRSALCDLRRVCDELRRQPGEHLDVAMGSVGDDYCAVLVRPGLMDVCMRFDDGSFDIRWYLRDHMAMLARAALVVQSGLRRWLIRRCLLPAATLIEQIALAREMCRTPVDPARALIPIDLYLRPVEGGLSWVYCDRDTRFDVVDALALLRPRPVRAAGRASSAAQRARQNDAFTTEERDWRRWRRTTLAWHEVTEVRGRLYRPRGDGRYDKRRFEAALESSAAAPSPRAMALAEWLRAGRDEALFAPTWDVWWSDYAESQGFDDFVVGAFEDFDDHVMLGYEDESVGESDVTWSGDDEPGSGF